MMNDECDSPTRIESWFNKNVVMVVVIILVVIVSVAAFRLATSDRSFRPQEYLGITASPRASPQAKTNRPFRPLPTSAF